MTLTKMIKKGHQRGDNKECVTYFFAKSELPLKDGPELEMFHRSHFYFICCPTFTKTSCSKEDEGYAISYEAFDKQKR